ncbi:hypothetical protein LTR85_010441 [Meristemomyces frigidus]|nr:hypothetical protein LTR85_010441 [Meristemomyces frigidus]
MSLKIHVPMKGHTIRCTIEAVAAVIKGAGTTDTEAATEENHDASVTAMDLELDISKAGTALTIYVRCEGFTSRFKINKNTDLYDVLDACAAYVGVPIGQLTIYSGVQTVGPGDTALMHGMKDGDKVDLQIRW